MSDFLELMRFSFDMVNLPFTVLLLVVMLYWGCVIAGAMDLDFFDIDADAEVDMDADVDVDVDADLDVDHDADVAPSVDTADALWLPFLSLRFWLFFVAFFGLVGTMLTTLVLEPTQWGLGLGISLGVGFVFGFTLIFRNFNPD